MEITFFGTTLADMVSECALWQDCILQPFRWPTICSGPIVWTSAASPKRESPQTTGHLLQLTVRATADQQFASLTNHQLIQRCPTFSPWLFRRRFWALFPPMWVEKNNPKESSLFVQVCLHWAASTYSYTINQQINLFFIKTTFSASSFTVSHVWTVSVRVCLVNFGCILIIRSRTWMF